MKNVLKFLSLSAVLVCFALFAGSAFAQTTTTGSIEGVITDSTGAAVADAVIQVARGDERQTATTGRDGIARFPQLGAGRWEITVSREGFSRWTSTIEATAGFSLPISLEVAGFSESVQVESVSGPSTQIPLNAPATGGSRPRQVFSVSESDFGSFRCGRDFWETRAVSRR